MISLFAVGVLAGLMTSAPPDPDADATSRKDEARRLLRDGNMLFIDQRYQAALACFEAAYKAFPSAKLLFNIAAAYEALNEPLLAARYFARFLREQRDDVRAGLTLEAEQRLAQFDTQLGRLHLDGWTPETRIAVDGAPVPPRWDIDFRLEPGSHHLAAERDGFDTFEVSFTVEPGAIATIQLPLSPRSSTPAALLMPPASPLTPPLVVEAHASADPLTAKWWFWSLVGGAALAAGTIAIVFAAGAREPFRMEATQGSSSVDTWERL